MPDKLTPAGVATKQNRFRKGPPRYLFRVKRPEKLNLVARNAIRRIRLCAQAQVPIHFKAVFYEKEDQPGYAKELAQWWAGIWKTLGFTHIEMLLNDTVIVEASAKQLVELLPTLPKPNAEFVFVRKEG